MTATLEAHGTGTGHVRLGAASYRRVGGLHVLNLRGDAHEMGRQHGVLLKDAVPRGPLLYYRTYVRRLLAWVGLGPLAPVAARILSRTVGRHVAKAFQGDALAALRGLAEGTGIPLERLLEGAVMPDTLLWTISRSARVMGGLRELASMTGFGCSSAVAWGDATVGGRLLHARNFDYHGVECWPREAAVIFHEPLRGLRYVSIASAGILLGGVTAMNEAGLTIAMHEHTFSDGAALGGTPAGVIGDRIMRDAHSLDEAGAILATHRPIGCWTYVIADGRRREVLCHEETPARRVSHRRRAPETTFRYTNFFLDAELRATEHDDYGAFWRHNRGRYRRLGERLAAADGALDPQGMAATLADVGDGACRLREPVASLLNVASVVFSPEDGRFWVATGETPASHRAFLPFDLARAEHAPEHGSLMRHIPEDGAATAAFSQVREAYLAYFDREDLAASRAHVGRARELAPREPLYAFLAGLVAIRAGDPRSALASFEEALALGHPDPERIAAAELWRARALDLCSERSQASRAYLSALESPNADAAVRAAARRGLRRPYGPREASRVVIDFAHADAVGV